MKRDKKTLAHWQKVFRKYGRLAMSRPLTSDERQQMAYANSKIEEEYAKPYEKPKCNGNCKPTMMSYDMACPIHGWMDTLAL